jgi:hypothetical protein
MNQDAQTLSLGERLVRAAHLAVAAHLGRSMASPADFKQGNSGRRIVIGGAGPAWFTEEPTSSVVDRSVQVEASDRSTLSAEGGAE